MGRLSTTECTYLPTTTFYTHRTRTWRWAKSRCSWKARTRQPPAPSRPIGYTTAPVRPPRTPSCARRSPGSPPGAPPSRRRHTRPAAGPTRTCPPPSPGPGVSTTGGRSSGKNARAPPGSSSSSRPAGTRSGSWGSRPPTSTGQHPYPAPPPPGARGAGRGTHLPANTGGHRRYGGPPSAAPAGTTRRPPGAQGPEPRPRLGAVARRVGRVAPPPPLPMPLDGRRPPPVRG